MSCIAEREKVDAVVEHNIEEATSPREIEVSIYR